MDVGFQEIGQVVVTMQCPDGTEGKMCKMTGNGIVSACANGDAFCGQMDSRHGHYGAVIVRGFITASYSGTAGTPGYVTLSANGNGGVKVDSTGRSYLAVAWDTGTRTVTFLL